MHRFTASLLAALTLASCSASPTDPATPTPAVAAATPDATAPSHALAFVAEGRSYLVISADPDVESVVGTPVVRAVGDTVVVEHTPAFTSPAADAWLGRVVRLYGPSGAVCEGVVHRSVLVGRYSPTPETIDRLKGEAVQNEEPLQPAEIVDEAWTGATGALAVVLAAEVDATGCDGAIWAAPADAPTPVVHPVTTADIADERAYLARFRALPSWSESQARYEEEAREDRAPRWDGHGESAPVVNVVDLGTSKMVFVTADVGGGCGDFTEQATVVFREDASGVHLMGTTKDAAFVPLGAADIDGDGTVELIVPGGLRKIGEGGYERLEAVEVRYLGCPC
jgi:hypothetical protein